MARKLVTREELATWMTAKLQQVEDCEGCSIGEVNLLKSPDADGCNWSDSLTLNTGGVSVEYMHPHLAKILAEARATFNVQ
ncbi:hypothetical protein ACVNIS_06475 [Sphaerotilaceae bacterium SBD11-9]